MRVLLIITLLLLSIGQAHAQGVPGAAPAPRPSPNAERDRDKTPKLKQIIGVCVRPGDMLTIEGEHLGALDDQVPALEVGAKALVLKVLNKTDQRFVVQLPKDVLEHDKTYRLVLAHEHNPLQFERTDLKVRVCPAASTVPQEPVAQAREILIFTAQDQRDAIISELRNRDIEIVRDHTLKALDSALIIIRGDGGLVDDLRKAFPEVEIDFNGDLSAAKGPRLYAKEKIQWPEKGACLDGAVKIPIGMIDGSIETSHPALAGQSVSEKNFLGDAEPDKSHGTAIASILVGNAPEQGFDGLLDGAKLYNAAAVRHTQDDQQLASIEAVLRGLDWLLAKDLRLINVSLAGKKNRVLVKAFEQALENGALIFAAAGNNGSGAPPVYPAAIDGVFAVTAIDAAGQVYKQANRGGYIDLSAPGVDVWVAVSGGGGAYRSGTSYAVPYAVAQGALYLSKNKAIASDVLKEAFSREKNLGSVCF